MATIKSFTSLEQSKKLAKILPLESADMKYKEYTSSLDYSSKHCDVPSVGHPFKRDIPCWSLAALLGVLPESVEFKGDKYYLRFMKDYVEYANDEVSITGRCLHTTGNDNLVDACVDVIMQLNGLNLL